MDRRRPVNPAPDRPLLCGERIVAVGDDDAFTKREHRRFEDDALLPPSDPT